MTGCRPNDAELARISEECVRCARVFLTYVLMAPITDVDLAFLRDRLLESLGEGYRVEATLESDGARVRVFDPAGVRIRDQLVLPHAE